MARLYLTAILGDRAGLCWLMEMAKGMDLMRQSQLSNQRKRGMIVFELVKTLCELFGPTNYEEEVQDYLEELWAPHVQTLSTDKIGNLKAHWGGTGPRVLIGAHADQIGMLVNTVTDDGFVWLLPVSGAARILKNPFKGIIGRPAMIRTQDGGEVWGVIAALSGHIETEAQSDAGGPASWDDLCLDIGVSSREEAESLGVYPGAPVMWKVETLRFQNQIMTSAVDDRVGLAIMSKLLQQVDPEDLVYEVDFVSTVQEEVGLVGAAPPVRDKDYDFGIALDVGLASDIPFVENKRMRAELGKGPLLVYKDSSVHYHKETLNRMAELAESAGIPHQRVIFHKFSSDGVIWIKEGLPTALVAWPTRYTHSPFEVVNEPDLLYTVELLKRFLTTRPS